MDEDVARGTLEQLKLYTKSICKFVGVAFEQSGKNHNGSFTAGRPFGAISHYTASNAAVTKSKPYGRIPVLLNRFARGGTQGVGVQFIVWDTLVPRFKEIRDKYPLLADIPAEVFYFGDDLSFWHAGWVNNWCYGIEVRNCGQLVFNKGVYFWGGGQNRYQGREPIKVGNSWWEPYTKPQMVSTLIIHRLMAAVHSIRPEWFLGHVHVSNTRLDPGPHFPIHEMREYTLSRPDVAIDNVEFLREFSEPGEVLHDDVFVSEDSLHKGLYRNDWDGTEADFDPDMIEYDGDGINDTATVMKAKMGLRSVGYYPGETDVGTVTEQFQDVIRIFQGRWKVRSKAGRFVNELPITGKLDAATLRKIEIMVNQYNKL